MLLRVDSSVRPAQLQIYPSGGNVGIQSGEGEVEVVPDLKPFPLVVQTVFKGVYRLGTDCVIFEAIPHGHNPSSEGELRQVVLE